MKATDRWMQSLAFTALFASLIAPAAGQQASELPLWPLSVPEAQGTSPEDRPTLLLYPLPSGKPRPAVVICPGGGYAHLAIDHEGRAVAEWFNGLGVAAFVLKYRLGPRYHYPVELLDAQRALRYVRANASIYNLDPDKIGIMGFSAGGHLAAMVATHFDAGNASSPDPIDRVSSRPDFLVLAYPVISCSEPFSHAGSCRNLLGDNPEPKLAEIVSNEKQVTAQTPPTFIFSTTDDQTVPIENSVTFYRALRQAGVPAELHIYEHGRHGVGLAPDNPALSTWPKLLEMWLRARGVLPQEPAPSAE